MSCDSGANASRYPIWYSVRAANEVRPTTRRSGQVVPSSRGS